MDQLLGVTPYHRHDRISAISALTLSPQRHKPNLFFKLLPDDKNVTGADVVAFLRQLRRHIPGPIILFLDGAAPHRAKVVQEYVDQQPQLQIESLPAYAPELNPDEGVWSYTKYGRMPNWAPTDTTTLRQRLTAELERLRHLPDILKAFMRQTKLPLRL